MKIFKRLPSRRFVTFTSLLCAAPIFVAWWRGRVTPLPPAKPYSFPTRELAELDRALQIRFAVVPDKDFGINRIGPRHGYFSPILPEEKQVVADLQKANQEVVFYVVGRNTVLRQRNLSGMSPVQGPVYITPHQRFNSAPDVMIGHAYQARFYSPDGVPKDVPTDVQLTQMGKRVFEDATLRQGTNGKINSWSVVARPVAASSQACVDCHNAHPGYKRASQQTGWSFGRSRYLDLVSSGDTLGVALYCYRPARKAELKKLTIDDLEAVKPKR